MKSIKIVTVGGGTGSNIVLRALQRFKTKAEIFAVVDVTDDGGSNRKIIDEFHLFPLSDIKQCISALYPKTTVSLRQMLQKLFEYRFNKGEGIRGQHLGNLFMIALSDILGSEEKAIKTTQEILKIKGKIIPVSLEKGILCAEYDNKSIVCSQHSINEPNFNKTIPQIKKVFIRPNIKINPEVVKEIVRADFIIFCPGDLYTSLIANLSVKGFFECLQMTSAKKIYIMNLMTKFGQTLNLKASNHSKIIEKYSKIKIDKIIINSAVLPKIILDKHKKFNEVQVIDDFAKNDPRIVRGNFANFRPINLHPADTLRRSLILHDPLKLSKILEKIISGIQTL